MIYTRADGTPIPRPEPEDYPDAVSYLQAFHAWRDAIADIANRGVPGSDARGGRA